MLPLESSTNTAVARQNSEQRLRLVPYLIYLLAKTQSLGYLCTAVPRLHQYFLRLYANSQQGWPSELFFGGPLISMKEW